uniref:Uncharacterized protein n=1 Tax=viral metagenome TaxID=1070528 RepID=A0A6M3LGV3_9ZZZZ
MQYELIYCDDGGVVIARDCGVLKVVVERFDTFSEYVSYVNDHVKLLEAHFGFIENVMSRGLLGRAPLENRTSVPEVFLKAFEPKAFEPKAFEPKAFEPKAFEPKAFNEGN